MNAHRGHQEKQLVRRIKINTELNQKRGEKLTLAATKTDLSDSHFIIN